MRRIVLVLIISLVGAGWAGHSLANTALRVDGTTVSEGTLRAELSAIAGSPSYQCYFSPLFGSDFQTTAGSAPSAAAAAAWTNMRVEGVAIENYVVKNYHFQPSASVLAASEVSLLSEMNSAAATASLHCPASEMALRSLGAAVVHEQVYAHAASMELLRHLPPELSSTLAGQQAYFAQHSQDYDRVCVSIALIPAGAQSQFAAQAAAGVSVATLAKSFSADPSATSGGAYGCYGPADSAYPTVRGLVSGVALDKFNTTPRVQTYSGATYLLYVAPTSRTTSAFASVASLVLSDIQKYNATSAGLIQQALIYHSSIAVDSGLGIWGASNNAIGVYPVAQPNTSFVPAPLGTGK